MFQIKMRARTIIEQLLEARGRETFGRSDHAHDHPALASRFEQRIVRVPGALGTYVDPNSRAARFVKVLQLLDPVRRLRIDRSGRLEHAGIAVEALDKVTVVPVA